MNDLSKTLAMRIEDVAGRERDVAAALEPRDPGAVITIDPATGIAHLTTTLDAIEVDDILTKAGFVVIAPTG